MSSTTDGVIAATTTHPAPKAGQPAPTSPPEPVRIHGYNCLGDYIRGAIGRGR